MFQLILPFQLELPLDAPAALLGGGGAAVGGTSVASAQAGAVAPGVQPASAASASGQLADAGPEAPGKRRRRRVQGEVRPTGSQRRVGEP